MSAICADARTLANASLRQRLPKDARRAVGRTQTQQRNALAILEGIRAGKLRKNAVSQRFLK